MVEHDYFCDNCMKPYEFSEEDNSALFICPVCNSKLSYWVSVEIDENTGKVTKKWWDEERQKSHPENKSFKPSAPKITCPYCKSTNTKKISGLSKAVNVGLFGIFALGKTTKQFHCNNCNADF